MVLKRGWQLPSVLKGLKNLGHHPDHRPRSEDRLTGGQMSVSPVVCLLDVCF